MRCMEQLSAEFKASGQISLYIDLTDACEYKPDDENSQSDENSNDDDSSESDSTIAPLERMLEYSGANLKLGELHVKGKRNDYLPPSLEKPVGVLATKANKVHLERMWMWKLEGDSQSNITTLKQTGELEDVSDDILSNIQEFEGRYLKQSDEKWCLLF